MTEGQLREESLVTPLIQLYTTFCFRTPFFALLLAAARCCFCFCSVLDRGFETVTYMLKGIMEHEDFCGHRYRHTKSASHLFLHTHLSCQAVVKYARSVVIGRTYTRVPTQERHLRSPNTPLLLKAFHFCFIFWSRDCRGPTSAALC